MNVRKTILPACFAFALVSQAGAEPDFKKDIKPILEARCVKCHGENKMEGELDLSTREGAEIGGEYGSAIVDGDVESSVLMQRIVLPKDDDEAMPSKGSLLKKEEIKKIADWIRAGAKWPEDVVLKEPKKSNPEAGEESAKKAAGQRSE